MIARGFSGVYDRAGTPALVPECCGCWPSPAFTEPVNAHPMPSETAQTEKTPAAFRAFAFYSIRAGVLSGRRCCTQRKSPKCRALRASIRQRLNGDSGDLYRDGVAGMAQLAVCAHVEHMGFEIGQLGLAVVRIGADDQAMTDTCLVGRGTVDRNDLRTFLAADGVGGEALAVVDVIDLDLFVFADTGQVQPLAIDGAGAFVVEHRVSYLGAVQFGLEHDGVHGRVLRVRKRRRVCPKPRT